MSRNYPQLLIADSKGRLYNLPELQAAAMKGGHFFRLSAADLVPLPSGSELFMLPQRRPVGYQPQGKQFVGLDRNPLTRKAAPCFAVACFVSPGFTTSFSSAYREIGRPRMLPLFSYAAVSFYKGTFYVTAVRVDRERRQDLRWMDINLVRKNARKLKKLFSGNRLLKHLEKCALLYSCPAAKNFFLSRYEAPLPTAPVCNARCLGCLSAQPEEGCSVTQPRISFVPRPEEVAEVALFHIKQVAEPVVSFGQGCEGEPLLMEPVLRQTIRLIRRKTNKGIINLNTNAFSPTAVSRLFDSGLDSMRVSLNSARAEFYLRYYLPEGYGFRDVLNSIKSAKKRGGFVSVNYLTMPGFTDSPAEFICFKNFIERYRIDMVQWRSLNFDPLEYFRRLKAPLDNTRLLGVKQLISALKKDFPRLMMGYFNPSRAKIRRWRGLKD